MPEKSEVIRGDKIGRRANDWYIWSVCPVCIKGRWILRWKIKLVNFTGLCWACSAHKNASGAKAISARSLRGDKNAHWNGGQTMSRGYVYIYNRNHPSSTLKGYVKRARLILEKKLGRYLLPSCIPHHINGDKGDDRPSNLIEISKSQHSTLHSFERRLASKSKSLGIKEVVKLALDSDILCSLEAAKQYNCVACQPFYAKLKELG